MKPRLGLSLVLGCNIFWLVGCSGPGNPAQGLASAAVDHLGCKTQHSALWTEFHRLVETSGTIPTPEHVREALQQAAESRHLAQGPALEHYIDAFVSYYKTTVDGIEARLAPRDTAGWKKALAEMEIGIRVTDIHARLADEIDSQLQKLDAADAALKVNCDEPPPGPPPAGPTEVGTYWEQEKSQGSPEVYGARKAFAVAYQSCDVLSLPPITAATPSIQGIVDLGPGSRPGGGHIRQIRSLASVNATHYYIANQRLAKNSCFEVRNDPLIYNFGGKPFTSSRAPSVLDLFTHTTSGGPTLGIDCSGYVFSALALAGLKLDPDPKKILKADLVWGIGSSAFKEPAANGLRCLQKISVTAKSSLKAGDIVAMNGHVLMIDAVGEDPFGLNGVRSLSECTTAFVKPTNFDFVIAQSAPVKGGIGIDRHRAVDYMPESSTIRNGLVQYALAACRARFGGDSTVNSPDLSVIRHLKTPECTAPQPLTMTYEACVDSCRPI